MTSAVEDHVGHSQGDTSTGRQKGQADDRQERWSGVSNQVATDRSGGREIRETTTKSGDRGVRNQVTTDRSGGREVRAQIIQNGDQWSVAKWPPTDQFSG